MTLTLEDIFAGGGFADIDASPLQRAICRAADGLPLGEGLTDEEVAAHFGCERSSIGLAMPVLVEIVAGVRGGKSFFAAAGALRDSLLADCSQLKAHELPRHAIVAPSVDNASATFRILCGIVDGSPVLRRLRVGHPTEDTLTLRRLDGRHVEIVVVAAHRGGMTLRSRWLAGATLEEVALFGIESTGAAVNAEELLRAAESRLLPNTQVRIVSSPMGRQGLLFDLYKAHFGKPGRVLVVHAPTRALNPSYPEAAIEALRARDADAAAREHDARWIDGETTFLDTALVDAAKRAAPLVVPAWSGATYVAAIDTATRGNGWTLIVAGAQRDDAGRVRVRVVLAHEWRGSREKPLSPDATFREMAGMLRPYGVERVHGDHWSFDANQDHARRHGLELVERSTADRDAAYGALKSTLASGLLELPPVEMLIQDLKLMRKILTPTGFRIDLPKTRDGRHCDYAPSVAMASWRAVVELPRDDGEVFIAPRGRFAVAGVNGRKDPYLVGLKRRRYELAKGA